MSTVQIRLAALWIALMLTYLLGDVLRIYAGDYQAGEVGGVVIGEAMWLGVAVILAIPIVLLLVSVFLGQSSTRWVHVLAAIALFAFNVLGLPTYPGLYDKALIVLGLVFNGLTVAVALRWK